MRRDAAEDRSAELADGCIATPTEQFERAQWAFRIDEGEPRRRYVLQHLLESPGMRVTVKP